MSPPTIAFAGLSHLGIVSAGAAASKGASVVAFDPDAGLAERCADGQLPVFEPGLDDLLAANAERLRFTSDSGELAACDVVYVAADVPTDDDGDSDLAGIEGLLTTATAAMREDATLVVLSQVPPGFTRAYARPMGAAYYQVETLIFGRAVARALEPERIIVGCADPGAPLPAPYQALLDAFGCPILPMRYESAEITKISINMCLVASISVANTMAGICERIGADWSEVAPALRLDARIGEHAYLTPGLGIAGGNLERDLATVRRLGDATGASVGTVEAWIADSRYRRDWVLRVLRERLLEGKPDASIGVLGLAYKEDTKSTRNSPALALIEELGACRLRVHDPLVEPAPDLHPNFAVAADPLDACREADAVALMTPWRQFRDLDPADIAATMKGRLVVDPYRVLDGSACAAAGLEYLTLGAPAP